MPRSLYVSMPMQDLENLTVTTFSLQAFALHQAPSSCGPFGGFPPLRTHHQPYSCRLYLHMDISLTGGIYIDYVLIPQTWISNCHLSQIIEDFDLGNQQQDHSSSCCRALRTHCTTCYSTKIFHIMDLLLLGYLLEPQLQTMFTRKNKIFPL